MARPELTRAHMLVCRSVIRNTWNHYYKISTLQSLHSVNTGVKRRPDFPLKFPWLHHIHSYTAWCLHSVESFIQVHIDLDCRNPLWSAPVLLHYREPMFDPCLGDGEWLLSVTSLFYTWGFLVQGLFAQGYAAEMGHNISLLVYWYNNDPLFSGKTGINIGHIFETIF